jgi:predicted nucleic acid-binding protein
VTKYAVDTNLYVRAFRATDAAEELERFFAAFAPVSYLSSIVLHELLVGVNGPEMGRRIDRKIAEPFRRRRRIVTPTHGSWAAAGDAIAGLAAEEGLDRRSLPRSFVNDVLLAASCRETGVTLVTENVRDFARIRRVLPFDFVPPWPGGSQTG